MPDEKKVDETWKQQVEKEKEKEGQRKQKESGAGAPGEGQATPEEKELSFEDLVDKPEAKFTVLIASIATQVFVSLGLIEHPISKKKETDLAGAKFSIDLLQLLSEKTRGNLTKVEERYLEGVLHELRMRYVEVSKQST